MIVFSITIFFFNLIIFMNYEKISKLYNLFDYPDHQRKKHKNPTPLFGGLAIFSNIFLYCLVDYFDLIELNFFQNKSDILIFFAFSFLFFFIGFIDDKYSISPNLKFLNYIVLITFLMFLDNDLIINIINFSFSSLIINLNNFSFFFTILCFLLFINSYNMLDGINGQAASYTIYILTIFLFLNINIILTITLIITILFFLYFNFKDKMFLGDSGTILMGFVLSYFFIKSHNMGTNIYSDEIFLIMMIPGFELLRLAAFRIIKKKHPFKPDNNHVHHYMIKKIGYLKSYLIIQGLLIFPYALYLIFHNTLISFIISFLIYNLLIYFTKNEK